MARRTFDRTRLTFETIPGAMYPARVIEWHNGGVLQIVETDTLARALRVVLHDIVTDPSLRR